MNSRVIPWLLLLLPFVARAGDSPPVPESRAAEAALLEALPVVEAAAMHAQTLDQAPANVTVVTAADIRNYGYRTLADVLAGVRGFYVTYDRLYHYVGVRGLSLPGDYNTRFLVMLNGHPLTENVYNSNGFFGQDFGLDMDLVERIEIIRGPTSALYGSNGILANINIITRSPVDSPGARASIETGSFGERKLSLSSSMYLGQGANLLLAVSGFNNEGQSLHFPELDSPETFNGWARGADRERGYHTFANLVWRNWNVTAYFNNRDKQVPVGWGGATFADPGNLISDSRDFINSAYTREVGATGKLRWDLYYDHYAYQERMDYPDGDALVDVRSPGIGDWAGSQLTYSLGVPKIGLLTVGALSNFEIRNLQRTYVASPVYEEQLHVDQPDRILALFAQQEWALSRRWKAYAGLRFESSRHYGRFASPRLALVYEYSPRTVYKLVYGRPFRNPSAYEQYYNDGGLSVAPCPPLGRESGNTFEISVERKLRGSWSAVVNIYHYRLRDLIEAVPLDDNVQQYRNGGRSRSSGVEWELGGRPAPWLDIYASLAVQQVRNGGGGVPNSPGRIAKARAAVPLWRNRFHVSSSFQYLSSRQSWSGGSIGPALVADITAGTNRLHPNFDLEVGMRNALDRRYDDPVYLAIERMRQDGRAVWLKLIWHTSGQ